MVISRQLVLAGAVVLGIGSLGAAYLRQDAGEASGGTEIEGPAPGPSGEFASVRLYKDPAPVPAFTVRTLDGTVLTAADLAGKVTLINFWATWCGPCRAEIPDLVKLQEKYRDHLTIVGISEDEVASEIVGRFAAEHRVNYPIAMSTPELQKAFPGVNSLPTTFILNRDGRLVQKHVGLLNAVLTENETRALAGLSVRAAVEYVDPEQPVGLPNAAQAKEIPGIDLTLLTPEIRVATLMRLNAEGCTCGCALTIAKCRIDDPACGVSLPIARRIAAEVASGAAVPKP